MKVVVKIGGSAVEDAALLARCARTIADLASDGHKLVLVHGGGAALTRTLSQLGKKSEFIDGLRVTDAETRDVALMVLAGQINKHVVAALAATGVQAIGLSGGDGLAFRARKKMAASILATSARSRTPTGAGSKPSGRTPACRCFRVLRSAATGSITTSTPTRWRRHAPSRARRMRSFS